MATQNMNLPEAVSARADISRTIEGIFDADYQASAFDPAVGGTPVAPAWGDITGALSAQTDLQAALDSKVSLSDYSNVIVVDAGGKGDYTDLKDALAAAPSGSLILVFGQPAFTGGGTNIITNTVHVKTIGNSVVSCANGSFYLATGGNLTLEGNFTGGVVNQQIGQTGTLKIVNSDVGEIGLTGCSTLTIINSTVTSLGIQEAIPSTAIIKDVIFTSSIISFVVWANAPFYNCNMPATILNTTVMVGNYSNIKAGVTWPTIP